MRNDLREIIRHTDVYRKQEEKYMKAMVFNGKKLVTKNYNEDSYDFIKSNVDGFIERVLLRDLDERNIDMWVNEDGKFRDLETTALLFYEGKIYDEIVGNIVFTRHEGEETTSLTDDDIKFIKEKFNSDGFYVDLNNNKIIQVLSY